MLLGPLVRLASDTTPASDREEAARELDEELRRWAYQYLGQRYERAPAALFDDAIQHCLMKASFGTARFRGTTQGEARNWCKSVLSHFVLDGLRRGHQSLERLKADEQGGRPSQWLDPNAPSPEQVSIGRDVQHLLERP